MNRDKLLEMLEDLNSGFSIHEVSNYFGMHSKKISRELHKNSINYREILKDKKLRSYEKRILDSGLTSLEDIHQIFSNDKFSRWNITKMVSKLINEDKMEKLICDNCEKGHNASYGSGRFCSEKCPKTYAQRFSDYSKLSKTLKSNAEINRWTPLSRDNFVFDDTSKNFLLKKKVGTPHTPESKKKLSDSLKRFFDENPEARERLSRLGQKRHLPESTRQKLSIIQKKRVLEGNHSGWSSRIAESYPEKVWSEVLSKNNVPFVREFAVNKSRDLGLLDKSNYFMDFLIVSKSGIMIDLEIDGKQHRSPERETSDISRDWAIRNSGVKVVRLPWINPSHDKKNFIRQVGFLLDIVRD